MIDYRKKKQKKAKKRRQDSSSSSSDSDSDKDDYDACRPIIQRSTSRGQHDSVQGATQSQAGRRKPENDKQMDTRLR